MRIPPHLFGCAVLAALLGVAGRPESEPRGTPTGGPPRASGAAAQAASLGQGPLRFEVNAGQVSGAGSSRVKFVARGPGYTLFLTSTGAVLSLRSQKSEAGSQNAETRNSKFEIRQSTIGNRGTRVPSPGPRTSCG
jgi:hypothetical protein